MGNDTKEKEWERTSTPGLYRRRGGKYYARVTTGGKTQRIPLETDLFTVAKIRFAERKALVERNRRATRDTRRGVARMGDLLQLYRDRVNARVDITEKTRELNLGVIGYFEKTWPGFSTLRPDEIKASAIENWRSQALSRGTGFRPPGSRSKAPSMDGRSPSLFNKAVDALRRMLDIAVDSGALHANVLAGRRGLKAKDKPRKPTLPETATLHAIFAEVESIGGRGVGAAELLRLLAFTGCRRNEAATLRWQDIDFTRGVIRVRGTKTDAAAREVPLIPAARELLLKIRGRREARAEIAVDGKPYVDPASPVLIVKEAQKSLTRACAKVGVEKLTHHDLRDAFATTCIESGVDVPTVAAWLGHADGGALLMRVYQHHRRPHSVAQAAKVDFGGSS